MDTRHITPDQVTLQIPESLALICPDARLRKEWEGQRSYFAQLQERFREGFSAKYALVLLDDQFQGGEYGTNIGLALRAHFFTEGYHSDGVSMSVSATLGESRGGQPQVHGQDYVLVAAGSYAHKPDKPFMSFDSSSCCSVYGYDSPKSEKFPLDSKKLYDALRKNYPEGRSVNLTDLLKELVHMEVSKAFEL